MRIKQYVAKLGALLAAASLAFGTAVVLPGTAAAGGKKHCPKYPIPSSHSKCPIKGGGNGHKGGNGNGNGKGNGKGNGNKGGSGHHHKKHHHKKHHHKK
jgi:hypothetical protein